MATVPRLNHYVPRFYLNQFASTRCRRSSLTVFDFRRGGVRTTSSRIVACESDFYRADLGNGLGPFGTEKFLGAEFEPSWSQAIKTTAKRGWVQDDGVRLDLV